MTPPAGFGEVPFNGISNIVENNAGKGVTFAPATVKTDSSGYASAVVTSGDSTGAVVITAHWGEQSIDFNLTVGSASTNESIYKLAIISGNNQRSTAVPNEVVTFSNPAGSAVTFSTSTATSNASGHTANFVRLVW